MKVNKLLESSMEMELEDVLCLLAEECCELAQAALKMRRVEADFMPSDGHVVLESIREEIADVLLCLDLLSTQLAQTDVPDVEVMYNKKLDRLYKRLVKHDET